MDLEQVTIQAIYETAVAMDAIYTPTVGDASTVRIVPVSDDLAQLAAAEIGLRGLVRSVYVRVSDVASPERGDTVTYRDTEYTVSEKRRIGEYEWQLYVVA